MPAMNRRLWNTLAALVTLSVGGLASAQSPPTVIVPNGPVTEAIVPDSQSARVRPLQKLLNNHGVGCWAHHLELGCGSFHSEFRFVFGSCRTFYGERCIPNPPHGDRDPYWRNPCASGKCNQDR